MKKFITSVLIGSIGGGLLAWGFLFIAPKLSDIFADIFYYPSTHTPVMVVQDIQRIFKPDTGQYFINSVDDSVASTTKVLYADLGSMNIILYEDGEKIREYPIQSVGREGTAWQTPLGTFDMSYKNENHFSSIGHVWMPYSMHFFGNYFIHGWPYYEGGTPVPRGYSGGCIRLNTPDAGEIFSFVDKDTQLVITTNKKPEPQKEFQYVIKNSAPVLESKFLVADIETGEVVASHDAGVQTSIGSFSKLMTGLISLETLNQYQETILDQNIVKISDVLYALLLGDSDEAGQILYEHKNKAQYLLDMNTRAKSLGMNQTKYKDTNGVDEATVSSLEDTFKLLQYVNLYKPFLLKVLSLDSYDFVSGTQVALSPLQNQVGYVAGFSNIDKTEIITLVSVDIFSPKTNSSEKKNFVIVTEATASSTVEQDATQLYGWLQKEVQFRDDI